MVSIMAEESRKRNTGTYPLDVAPERFPLTLTGRVCAAEWQVRRVLVRWVDSCMEYDRPLHQEPWLCRRNHISKTRFRMLTLPL